MTESLRPEPLVIYVNGQYIHWLVSNSAPGTPGLDREQMETYLTEDEGLNEFRVKVLLDRACLYGTSDPDLTIDELIASAQAHHPNITTADDLALCANRP